MEMAGVDRRYTTHTAQLGLVVLTGGMVDEDDWGRIYLIRLRRPLELPPQLPEHCGAGPALSVEPKRSPR